MRAFILALALFLPAVSASAATVADALYQAAIALPESLSIERNVLFRVADSDSDGSEKGDMSAPDSVHAESSGGDVPGRDSSGVPPEGRTSVDSMTVTLRGSTTMDFVHIAPGTFTMGSPNSETGRYEREGPQHKVTISEGFYLGKYEVTQGQWKAVMGNDPSAFSDNNKPVEQVSWDDVHAFIHRLNVAAGDSLYRLPTEAEWEYACRAGTTTRWSFGEDERQLKNYAWYKGNNSGFMTRSGTKDVGKKLPNPWGLYDMYGNVYEWCQDWYEDYTDSPQTDPAGPPTGTGRVIRGGDWYDIARSVRSADRGGDGPDDRNSGIGFRLLRRAK